MEFAEKLDHWCSRDLDVRQSGGQAWIRFLLVENGYIMLRERQFSNDSEVL
jgi:hypothetical protein